MMVTRRPHVGTNEQTGRSYLTREDKGKRSKEEGARRRKRRVTKKSLQWEKEKRGDM